MAPAQWSLPNGMRVAGAWSWRLLVIGAVIAVVVLIVMQLSLIVIPVMLAVLIAALLTPVVDWLHGRRWPRGLAVAAAFLLVLVVVGALVMLVVWQVRMGLPDLKERSGQVYAEVHDWLLNGPLDLSEKQITAFLTQVTDAIQRDSQVLVSGALSFGTTIGHLATGLVLTMFSTLFILFDGRGIWGWIVRIFPRRARQAIDVAGRSGWTTLGNFVRVQILVATIDAVGIALGSFILGLPLAVPIGVLVFLGSFVPVVGAVLTGAVAVFIALIYNGWVIALIMLGVVLLVQEIEGHVLQPLIMGSAVKVHPLAVVLAVAAGTLLAGIPGALFSVPLAAVGNVMIREFGSGSWRRPEGERRDSGVWWTVPATTPRMLRR